MDYELWQLVYIEFCDLSTNTFEILKKYTIPIIKILVPTRLGNHNILTHLASFQKLLKLQRSLSK